MAKSKTEIDKENMFNRLMPTRKTESESSSPSQVKTPAITNPVISATPRTVIAPPEPPPMPEKGTGIVMKNIAEHLVADKIDAVFNKFNCCKCERCKQDVTAIALNRIKPKYVIAHITEIDNIAAKQNQNDIMSALVQAVLVVIAHPRH